MKKIFKEFWKQITRPQLKYSEISGAILIQALKKDEQEKKESTHNEILDPSKNAKAVYFSS